MLALEKQSVNVSGSGPKPLALHNDEKFSVIMHSCLRVVMLL